jgi:hypothetical protein
MTKQNKIFLLVSISVLALVVVVTFVFLERKSMTDDVLDGTDQASIDSFTIDKPYLIVRGKNLFRVEIWGVQLHDISGSGHLLLGNETKSPKNFNFWFLEIPETPMSLSRVYAKGFDRDGNLVATSDLTLNATSSVYEALWMDIFREEMSLNIGESGEVLGFTIKLINITEDSRCPIDVQCIQAGRVVVTVDITGKDKKVTRTSIGTDKLYTYDGYFIEVSSVKPENKKSDTKIDDGDYEVMLTFSKDLKL